MVHKNIMIHGRVQGVGFRYAARKVAYQFGIKGFVKNLKDGGVYIEAEGEEASIAEYIKWCHTGPFRADVQSVSVRDGQNESFNDFIITM